MRNISRLLTVGCISAGIIFSFGKINAQSWNQNGNSVSPGNFIGSTNKAALDFKTNDTLRMRIDTNGFINMRGRLVADSGATFTGQVIFDNPSGDAIVAKPGITPPLCPTQDDQWFSTDYYSIMGALNIGSILFPNYIVKPLIAFGVGTQNPQYMEDILCTAGTSLNDINISTTYTVQNVGYRIGGNYVLWHDGNPQDIFVGVNAAGGINNTHEPSWSGVTVMGYNAGYGLGTATTGGIDNNTFVGSSAGYSFAGGSNCTYIGTNAGYSDAGGLWNTFIGWDAGYYTNGTTFPNGQYNTFTGAECGLDNVDGYANCYYGKLAAARNDGFFNSCYGSHCGEENLNTDSNSFYGTYCAQNMDAGNCNVFVGFGAGGQTGPPINPSNHNVFVGNLSGSRNPNGNYNTLLGDSTDAYLEKLGNYYSVFNSGAIGADVKVNFSNQMILGNNSQFVGIGESSDEIYGGSGPQWNLEISTEHNNAYSLPGLGGGIATASNPYSGTGFSGLKFRDLTSNSIPVVASTFTNTANPFPTGVLSVDGYGNVIYVQGQGGTGLGIGYCSPPNGTGTGLASLTSNGGYDLNSHNLYFKGNGSTSLADNSVIIGNDCGYTPLAKLDVLQASNVSYTSAQSSIGIYVENDDLTLAGTNTAAPVIGIKSYVPAGHSCQAIAGWFEVSPPFLLGCNDAIIVPPNGGNVGIGTTSPGATLEVDGTNSNIGQSSIICPYLNTNALMVSDNTSASTTNTGIIVTAANATTNYGIYATANTNTTTDYAGYFVGNVYTTGGAVSGTGYLTVSDSTVKTKVDDFSNALSIIKRLKPKTYYYDSSNNYKMKLDTFMHYGFIAQQVKRIVPCMVHTVAAPAQIDSNKRIIASASTMNALDYNQFAAILTAGFQEQLQIGYNDSVKQKQTNDSLRYTVDSLRNAFKNIQSCLDQLCSDGHHSIRRNGSGDSNSGNNNATTANVQDVVLSSLSSAPLLYQNTPNPFSTGTKINYYLPQGTEGAVILFYDNYGNQIKEVKISQTGNGTLNITPDNLSNGIYSYSLVVNGNVIDTKRMVLQK